MIPIITQTNSGCQVKNMLLCYFLYFSKFVYLLCNIFSAKNFTHPFLDIDIWFCVFRVGFVRIAEDADDTGEHGWGFGVPGLFSKD